MLSPNNNNVLHIHLWMFAKKGKVDLSQFLFIRSEDQFFGHYTYYQLGHQIRGY